MHAAKLIGEISLGLTAVSFLLVFLLPRHARPGGHGDASDAASNATSDVASDAAQQEPALI